MEYNTRDFFTEKDDQHVKGFAIIDTDGTEGYRIAEKWDAPEKTVGGQTVGGEKWYTYWMPEDAFIERVQNGYCEKTRELSDKQYSGLLNLI